MNIFEIIHTPKDTIYISDKKVVRGWGFLGEETIISLEEFNKIKVILTFEIVSYENFESCYENYLKYWKGIMFKTDESSSLNRVEETEISLDEFIEKYKPIEENGVFKQFETYGEEWEKVKKTNPKKVWTVLDGEGQSLILTNGIWQINRMYYLICEVECNAERGIINIDY